MVLWVLENVTSGEGTIEVIEFCADCAGLIEVAQTDAVRTGKLRYDDIDIDDEFARA